MFAGMSFHDLSWYSASGAVLSPAAVASVAVLAEPGADGEVGAAAVGTH